MSGQRRGSESPLQQMERERFMSMYLGLPGE